MTKRTSLSVSVGAASVTLAAGLFISNAMAQVPTPNTYTDWPVPQLTEWNSINALTVDPTDPEGRTYIYPGGFTPDPADPEDGSVALIHWDLDDASGRAPGIQVVTDDLAFPTHNCVMASGERESEAFPGTIVPKTCSDDPGSSKRVFLEITEADVPVDLVFNTGVKDIRYKGIRDPQEDGGVALEAFRQEYGIGRIYRVIQKFINDTDERIVEIRVELGTGVGADFEELTFGDDGVAFELRPFVDREFFVGSTGAPDRRVWNPERFAHFSPKMFDTGERTRFEPGFFDDNAAGLFPPQDYGPVVNQKSQRIYSGQLNDGTGRLGAITPNYFNMPANQAFGLLAPSSTLFGYFLPDDLGPRSSNVMTTAIPTPRVTPSWPGGTGMTGAMAWTVISPWWITIS